jgi:hypothetical protein
MTALEQLAALRAIMGERAEIDSQRSLAHSQLASVFDSIPPRSYCRFHHFSSIRQRKIRPRFRHLCAVDHSGDTFSG